jgi:hypothetical protein
MQPQEPQEEHRWLEKFVGDWTYIFEHEAGMTPDNEPGQFTGSESARSIGGLWILAEGKGKMPDGGDATMFLTIGYDPQRKRYVGTWIGSMMTTLWIYDGWLDEAKTTITLEAEGPSMSGDGKIAKYRDIHEFKNRDYRVARSMLLGDDGQWKEFMKADYRRKK